MVIRETNEVVVDDEVDGELEGATLVPPHSTFNVPKLIKLLYKLGKQMDTPVKEHGS